VCVCVCRLSDCSASAITCCSTSSRETRIWILSCRWQSVNIYIPAFSTADVCTYTRDIHSRCLQVDSVTGTTFCYWHHMLLLAQHSVTGTTFCYWHHILLLAPHSKERHMIFLFLKGSDVCTWFVPKLSVLIFHLIIYWTYLKLQVISYEV